MRFWQNGQGRLLGAVAAPRGVKEQHYRMANLFVAVRTLEKGSDRGRRPRELFLTYSNSHFISKSGSFQGLDTSIIKVV